MPASYEVIHNSSSPLFGAIYSAIWLGESLTLRKASGLLAGASGVALVAGTGQTHGPDVSPLFGIAVGACLLAAACYGLAAVYIRKRASQAKPAAIAGASQLCAGLLLLPLLPFDTPHGVITPAIIAYVLCLAFFCSAIAYLLYYRLIQDLGPTRALTVTFLMPIFGIFWGAIFLGESVTLAMIGGCALVVLGTAIVLFSPKPV